MSESPCAAANLGGCFRSADAATQPDSPHYSYHREHGERRLLYKEAMGEFQLVTFEQSVSRSIDADFRTIFAIRALASLRAPR
jgi:hypothetical protein